SRGIARHKDQTFRDLFNERQILYNKYAEFTIDCINFDQEEIAEIIASKVLISR
ncbi:MAG: shikimate kinase, partial [Deltaproteobacteria bacterium]|nr:shikimate kinase [Deltaproteobacteria bacterium]